MNTEHRQQKISFWHSMKTQFIAVVILVAAVIVILYTLMIMPGVKSNIRSIYSDYLLDLSISYGREMESAMQVNIDLLDNPEAAQKDRSAMCCRKGSVGTRWAGARNAWES